MRKAMTTWTEPVRVVARVVGAVPVVRRVGRSDGHGRVVDAVLRRPVSPQAPPPVLSPVMPPPARPPAGWYSEGADEGYERWWDGGSWTLFVQRTPEPAGILLV